MAFSAAGGCLLLFLLLWFYLTEARGSVNSTSCSVADLDVLQDFLTFLHGGVPGWPDDTTADHADCCNWRGVSCGAATPAGRRVVGLDLPSMSLNGSVSPSLARLNQLAWLNLSVNSLYGPVPAALFHHRRLQCLDLSNNELTGTIPQDAALPAIRVFNISFNGFTGTHPALPGSPELTEFDVSFNRFTGHIAPAGICSNSSGSSVKLIRFSMNMFTGKFPSGFGGCVVLEELAVEVNDLSGELPDDVFTLSLLRLLHLQRNQLSGALNPRLSNLSSLQELHISDNAFSGEIPDAFLNLWNLEYFFGDSNGFTGSLPASLASSPSLRVLYLRNNSLIGEINLNCSAMVELISLDLSINSFTGTIDGLTGCLQLRNLNLGRNSLTGGMPPGMKNLNLLSQLSLSSNGFTGVAQALTILQSCVSLTSLVLTKNFRDGKALPSSGIYGFDNVEVFVIANSGLTGTVPPWLARSARLKVLDLSWNQLTGVVPPWIGQLELLFYVDLSNNSLSGEIPESLTKMKALVLMNQSKQTIDGGTVCDVADMFPYFIKKNTSAKGLQYNQVSSFPPSLVLSHNKLTGVIPPGLGRLKNLHVLDLGYNRLSGGIPTELSGLSSLETLDLSRNILTGGIPPSLVKLNFLSSFSVAFNNLSGEVPSGGQFLTFARTDFDGNPFLCGFHLNACERRIHFGSVNGSGTGGRSSSSRVLIGVVAAAGVAAAVCLVAIVSYVVVRRRRCSTRWRGQCVKGVADSDMSFPPALDQSSLVVLFENDDGGGGTDKVAAAVTMASIWKSTNNFDEANIVGCGGFGLVYKATLPDGARLAVKRLSGEFGQMEREFTAEIEALSKARHRNLVPLQGYCRTGNDRLLLYTYMENGSLDYWLHEKEPDSAGEGRAALDWRRRLNIAVGAARGLAYLHHSCQPHILHRDVKSSNILLDERFEPRLADFGLARLLRPSETHVTTDFVGTLGYIPPEYGQSSAATYKGDVYSFGVVLLELVTGRRAVEMARGRGRRDLVAWVTEMKAARREEELLDPAAAKGGDGRRWINEMKQVLGIACACVSVSPRSRPPASQLVPWLESVGGHGREEDEDDENT